MMSEEEQKPCDPTGEAVSLEGEPVAAEPAQERDPLAPRKRKKAKPQRRR